MRTLLALVFLALASTAAADEPLVVFHLEMQTSPPNVRVGSNVRVIWDLTQQQLTDGAISRGEVSLDAVTWATTGAPVVGIGTNGHTFNPGPVGTGKTIRVRWCNAAECGAAASLTFNVIPMMPNAPSGMRFGSGQVAISIPQAIDMAHAYSMLAKVRKLNDAEIWVLSSKYGRPLTQADVLAFMDDEYWRLPEY